MPKVIIFFDSKCGSILMKFWPKTLLLFALLQSVANGCCPSLQGINEATEISKYGTLNELCRQDPGATAGCFQSQALTWYCGRECYGVSHFQCKILYCDSDPKMVSMMCDCGSYTSEAVSLSQLFRNFQQQCILQQSSFAQSQVQQHQYGSSNGAGFFVQPGVQSQYSAPNEVGNAVAPPLVMRPKPYIEPAYAASPSRMCSPYC